MERTNLQTFRDQVFDHIIDRDSHCVFSDMRFERCTFESCAVSVTRDVALRSTIRNVEVIDCKESATNVRCAIIEDCLVDRFQTEGGFFYFQAAVFKHVTFRGNLGKLFFSDVPTFAGYEGMYRDRELFAAANAEYYRKVDWAIDISQAEFLDVDLRSVPPRLIRRDPETQILLTRKRLTESDWQNLPYVWGMVPYMLNDFLINQPGMDEMVFAVPKRSRNAKKLIHDVALLRKAGVPEPD
jgi:hypothetical protein